jgi:hypothetical protein
MTQPNHFVNPFSNHRCIFLNAVQEGGLFAPNALCLNVKRRSRVCRAFQTLLDVTTLAGDGGRVNFCRRCAEDRIKIRVGLFGAQPLDQSA